MVTGLRLPALAGILAGFSIFNIHSTTPDESSFRVLSINKTDDVATGRILDRPPEDMLIQVPKRLRPIIDGSLDLIGIHFPDDHEDWLANVNVTFCALDWSFQKGSPNSYPRYFNLIRASNTTCAATRVTAGLKEVLAFARIYDQTAASKVHLLERAGYIFHESRCGSTLAANMLTVADPQGHRVYSEPTVVQYALSSRSKATVESVLYLMSRSNDPLEKKVFFKLRSTCTRRIKYMPDDSKWMFFYRNPDEVMASHFHPGEEKVGAIVCLQSRNDPAGSEIRLANKAGYKTSYSTYAKMSEENVCAIRFASLSHAAIVEYNHTGQGRFINYNTLPQSLWESHFPDYFGIDLYRHDKTMHRLQAIAGVYSKGSSKTEVKQWDDQGEKKHEKPHITKRQRKAAGIFMQPDYDYMEMLSRGGGNVQTGHRHHHHHH